ncbi:MAG: hypothetical protein ACE366_24060 [Bradymonadia bacterium]
MASERREREMVLAPNEYAYVLDTTKGHVNCYVGPNKTSLAQTDQPVVFNGESKRFEHRDLSDAVCLFATAPANWYLVLKNPAQNGAHPTPGNSNAQPDLDVGRKVIVSGPASFPLWPGQMAKVIEGHRLRSNTYIYVRIYDVEAARAGWWAALARGGIGEGEAPEPPDFIAGEQRIIKGTEVSFYIPPTGVEVIPDSAGRFVRQAVTLQRLEYCVLVADDGRKRSVRGEAVVFPEPGERFLERGGQRKSKAIELSEITGVHVKVIAPYTDEEGVAYREGEELFLTGKDEIYFPREEHAIIRYGRHEVHRALAIPRGEGRYLLDRITGEITLKAGPTMCLPDPRREVIVRRVLTPRECALMFPGDEGARRRHTQGKHGAEASSRPQKSSKGAQQQSAAGESAFTGDAFTRPTTFEGPRTLTLDGGADGVITLDIWSGHAVQIVDRAGARRVVQGPASVMLAYDETVQPLSLSTGTPKTDRDPLHTAHLQVAGNKVSDQVEVITADLVRAQIHLTHRVTFEGPAEQWFAVADYVKLLCDHTRSKIKALARQRSIRALRASITELIRDALLGPRPESGARPGLRFEENGMRVYDVEVLGLEVADEEVAQLLAEAQRGVIKEEIEITHQEAALARRRRLEAVERALLEESQATELLGLALTEARAQRVHEGELARREQLASLAALERAQELADTERVAEILERRLANEQAVKAIELEHRRAEQALDLTEFNARVEGAVRQAEAIGGDLTSALHRLADAELMTALSENFGEMAAVEAQGLLATARRFLDFAPASVWPALKAPESDPVEAS